MAVTAQMAVVAAPSMSSSRRRCVALPAGGFRAPLKQRRQRAGLVRVSGMAEAGSQLELVIIACFFETFSLAFL